jgi:hypothetical protein
VLNAGRRAIQVLGDKPLWAARVRRHAQARRRQQRYARWSCTCDASFFCSGGCGGHTAGYEGIFGPNGPKVGYVIRRNPPMSLPYCLPQGLWVIYCWIVFKIPSKSAVCGWGRAVMDPFRGRRDGGEPHCGRHCGDRVSVWPHLVCCSRCMRWLPRRKLHQRGDMPCILLSVSCRELLGGCRGCEFFHVHVVQHQFLRDRGVSGSVRDGG